MVLQLQTLQVFHEEMGTLQSYVLRMEEKRHSDRRERPLWVTRDRPRARRVVLWDEEVDQGMSRQHPKSYPNS